MQIAVCDDDSLELAHISSILNNYRQERNIHVKYQTYLSATELLSTMKIGQYDVILLDILMPGFTGIDAAREIRTFDDNVKIIFLTSSPEFALDSYAVKALDYMLKPISKEKLFCVLDLILSAKHEHVDGLSVKIQNGIARILFNKIAFVEIMNKRLYFHLSDNTIREVYAPMSEYEKHLLLRPEFIKVHRSYIVNLWQMSELTANGFVTNCGENVPISRLLYSDVRKAYMEHLFVEK